MEHKYPVRITKEEAVRHSESSSDKSARDALKKLLAQKVRDTVDRVSKANIECSDHNLSPSISAFSGEDPDPFCLVLIFKVCCKKMGKRVDEYLANGN